MGKNFGQTFGGGLISGAAKPLLDLGIGLINTSQQKKLQDKAYQQSMELERVKQQNELQLQKEQQKALEIQRQVAQLNVLASQKPVEQKPKKKWVLPVAIGGGLLLVGAIIFFVTRKK